MDSRHGPSPSLRSTGQVNAYRPPRPGELRRSPGRETTLPGLGEVVAIQFQQPLTTVTFYYLAGDNLG